MVAFFTDDKVVIAVLAPIATVLLTLVVTYTGIVIRHVRHWMRWHTRSFRISLEPREGLDPTINRDNYKALSEEIIGFYCTIPRFGSEEYLERFASDEERVEGRWWMKVIKLPIEFDQKGNAELILKLPIHKFLGTQFKCFIALKPSNDPNDDLEARMGRWTQLLRRCKSVPTKSYNPKSESVDQGTGPLYNRLYFLLVQFSQCSAGPTIQNNWIHEETGDFPAVDLRHVRERSTDAKDESDSDLVHLSNRVGALEKHLGLASGRSPD